MYLNVRETGGEVQGKDPERVEAGDDASRQGVNREKQQDQQENQKAFFHHTFRPYVKIQS